MNAYCTVQHLASVATRGWFELAERSCPQQPDMDPALLAELAAGHSTSGWPADWVQQAQDGLARIELALDMASRHVDTYLYPKYRTQMPLASEVINSSPLPDVVALLALRRLYGTSVPEDMATAVERADKYLSDLSKGLVSLGVADVAQPAVGETLCRAPAKAFDWGAY